MTPRAARELMDFEAQWTAFAEDDEPGLEDLLALAQSDDPFEALGCVGLLKRWLDERADELVLKARIGDASWAWIGSQLGMTKQGAWERYRDSDPRDTDDT